MGFTNDVVAAFALALVGPAVLFVTALFIRQLPLPDSQPTRTADRTKENAPWGEGRFP